MIYFSFNELLHEVGVLSRNFVTVGVYAMWSGNGYIDNFVCLNIIAISIANRLIDITTSRQSKFQFHIRMLLFYQKSKKFNALIDESIENKKLTSCCDASLCNHHN